MRAGRRQIHVAAIGDSITAGSPWDDDPAIGWPAAAAVDPRLRFTVRAGYGKRTDEIAAWLDEAAAGADVLVVQGGINPCSSGSASACCASTRRSRMSSVPGRMREEWAVDGDHPSLEGYRRLGELAFRLP
jgi:lysophospholipase L1-like esterase